MKPSGGDDIDNRRMMEFIKNQRDQNEKNYGII